MNPLSNDERRALGLLLALLLLAAAARWVERPRSLLDDVSNVDIATLEAASRTAKAERNTKSKSAPPTTKRASDASAPPRNAPRTRQETVGKIDPNRASIAELDALPGVGASLAARIVAAREQAPFNTLDDLRRVAGIGPALLARLAEHVTLPPGTGTAATPERNTNPSATTPSAPRRTPATPIDLNRATAAELDAIPGIGPALAARLVARRDSLRRFRSFDEVDAVPGVGVALLARIRAATVLR